MNYFIFSNMRNFAILVIIVIAILGLDTATPLFAIPIILAQNIYMIIASKRNLLLLYIVIIIAYSNYSALYAIFINPIDSWYATEITKQTTNISLNILLIFNCILVTVVKWNKMKDTSDADFYMNVKVPLFYAYLLLLILIVVFFYGFTIPTELGERGSPKPIYEYALVFFILLFGFFKKNMMVMRIGFCLVILYSLQNFIFGGRILGIQFILCTFLMIFMNKIPPKVVLLLLTFFFLLMTFVGIVRGEFLSANFDLSNILSKVVKGGFALDTAYSAYYCAESFVYCHHVIPQTDRLFLFGEFLKGIFISSDPQYVLHNVTSEYVHHTGGGYVPHFFYFYLGPIGVFFGGLLISVYLNIVRKFDNNSSGLVKCLVVFVTCITFRWYLYSPLDLLRGGLFLVIVYYSFMVLIGLNIKRKHTCTTQNLQLS